MKDKEKIHEEEAGEWTPPSPEEEQASAGGDAATLTQALEQKTKEAA
jgi:hypothetical protein